MSDPAAPGAAERAARDLQLRLVGSWRGRARLWFEPGEPAHDQRVEGEILDIGGRWVRHDYSTPIGGTLELGSALIGCVVAKKNVWQIAWVDSFHTASSGVMLSTGALADTATKIDALGSYEAGDGPRWGWRTEYEPVEGGLVVRHFNLTPDGEETLAVQFDYGSH